jgi:succinyl-diaminopimelate desuccinylase
MRGTLSFLITGDEEGPSVNGTAKLLRWALDAGHRFDAALVGEPTSRARLGDTMKSGRRGSLSGTIVVTGKQGHVAYPHLADNPIPRMVDILSRLAQLKLDEGTADFQPSNLEITAIEVDNKAFNVIPGEARARFNIRFNDTWNLPKLTETVRDIVRAGGGDTATLTVTQRASEWFLTRSEALLTPLAEAVRSVTGITPEATTGGGTSDARFFKDVCPVVEFGPVGDTMHQVDEHIPVADLEALTEIYRRFIRSFLTAPRP